MDADYDAEQLTTAVLDRFSETQDPRLRQVFEAMVRHTHAFIKETQPTIEEWQAGIDFLTAIGQKCDDLRQEFILFSDVIGVSMLTEIINDRETPDATDSTVLGPFHTVVSPVREIGENISAESSGEISIVRGIVTDSLGQPVAGAQVDVWQANQEGFYDVQQPGVQSIGNGRGLFTTAEDGAFWFQTVIPNYYPVPTDGPVGDLLAAASRHPYRPAHIHFIVKAPGFDELTTHIFIKGSPYIDSDTVFAVKESLVYAFDDFAESELARDYGVSAPFKMASLKLVLHSTGSSDA